MTSRERVCRCLEFDFPDRVPRDPWTTAISVIQHGRDAITAFKNRWPSDIGSAPAPKSIRAHGDLYSPGIRQDDWGCRFLALQAGVKGEVKDPILGDYSKLDSLRPPVELLQVDIDEVNRFCAATDKYVYCPWSVTPFERMQFLRGSEDLYMDLGEESGDFRALFKLVTDFYREQMQVWAKTNVDALMFADDWGSQRSLLISPTQWRRLFKPIYAEYARIAHSAGKKLFMHSDGYIFDIYPDLVEIGVDAINSQLFCMNIEEIGRRFAGKITFWGEIDRQHVLPYGTVADARAAVRRVVDNLYRPNGGVIAQFEFTGGTRLENAHAIFEAWEAMTASHGPSSNVV